MLHRNFERTHTERPGFGKSLLVGPMIVGDAIAGDGGSSAVGATPAMYKDRPLPIVIEQGKNGRNLSIVRRPQAAPRHANVLQPGALYSRALGILAAQIDNRFNAQLGQTREGSSIRLRSAVDVFVHLMEVADAGDVEIGTGLEQGDAKRKR